MSEFLMQESSKESENPSIMNNREEDFVSIACLEKLGMDENPFVDHARDPYLYIDDQLEMSINVLIDYLQNQNSTLILLGEIGIGKTTLLRLLLRKGYQDFNFCTLRAKKNLSFEEIEDKIKQRWSLGQTGSADELTTDEYIKQFIESKKCPVLVIDDAHRLDTRNLDLLFQLKHRVGLQSSSTLGLILSAEPTIQVQISELEQSNPAATHVYQTNVRTFDNSQCEKYINFRLEKAGIDDVDFFDSETKKRIYEASLGLPRVINRLSRIEIVKKSKRHSEISKIATEHTNQSKTKQIAMLALGLLGLAVLAFVFIKKPNDVAVPANEQEIVQTEQEKAVVNKTINKKNKLNIENNSEENKNIKKPYVAPLVLGKLKLDEAAEETSSSKSSTEEALAEKEKSVVKPKKEIVKEVVKENTPQLAKQESEQASKPVPQISKDDASDEVNKAQDGALQTNAVNLYAPSWLLEQSPEAFTIQIVASPNENNLADFNDKYLAGQLTAYYKKTRDDKQWYVLVHGIYSTRDQAVSAISAMPETIKKNKPYPLQLKYIQEVIRN